MVEEVRIRTPSQVDCQGTAAAVEATAIPAPEGFPVEEATVTPALVATTGTPALADCRERVATDTRPLETNTHLREVIPDTRRQEDSLEVPRILTTMATTDTLRRTVYQETVRVARDTPP